MTPRKISQIDNATQFDRLRKQKVRSAIRDVTDKLNNEVSKLNYAVHFWHGAEGVSWFMNKNSLDAEQFQNEFEERNLVPYLTPEETHEVSVKVKEATQKYLAELNEILDGVK